MNLTDEQKRAIECEGKAIVSASAGSGKTFVMIKKIISAIERGVDLENVLAVTFTKKAAAQMKEKLRQGIIESLKTAEGEARERLKLQLTKVSAANISTIHSFAAKILRTYFYAAGVDGGFTIMAADDAEAKRIKKRAMENLFERKYEENDENFKLLLKCFVKKRDDGHLQALIYSAYEKLRINARYTEILNIPQTLFTDEGFDKVCAELKKGMSEKYSRLYADVKEFADKFISPREIYKNIFADMLVSIDSAKNSDIFSPRPKLTTLRKPACKTDAEKEEGERFSAFRDEVAERYKDIYGDIGAREFEKANFLKSGETAKAFCKILREFDTEYSAVKADNNKLDYNDLEHKTLSLLQDSSVLKEITSTYSYVFVDEYQDVNPVQEEIISNVGGKNLFLVGDVKQAIYGFRGSKSLYFAEKYNSFEGGGGSALKLSSNFRSCKKVITFVNSLFSEIMRADVCGIDYLKSGIMRADGGYPESEGEAKFAVFGEDEEETGERGVYSVEKSSGARPKHTREALAVLSLVERVLGEKRYDLKSGKEVDIQAGDICILTRKKNDEAAEIIRALSDAGYMVSGAQDSDISVRPEIKQILDILSLIDNGMQDIPLATALLSPLGNMTHDELAKIRIADRGSSVTFRDCCKKYADRVRDGIAEKLNLFFERAEHIRALSDILTAAEIIDKVLEITGLESAYSSGGGEKLKNIRRLSKEGEGLSVSEFLLKLKDGGALSSSPSSSSNSIKIMTMHASKGLEFPVVIIADVAATFKGRDERELPFDGELGFAPKVYDAEKRLTYPTLLRRLISERSSAEDLKNEYNLYYVACTRAMNKLFVLAREIPEHIRSYNPAAYTDFADISKYEREEINPRSDFERERGVKLLAASDKELVKGIADKFMRAYAHEESINLPVKSSASAILKLGAEDEIRPHELFPSEYEKETNAERGTAYHRFLELCDFTKKSEAEIKTELDEFVNRGDMTARQRDLIEICELFEILSMPVFEGLGELYREQEFLCRLPAKDVLPDTTAEDFVLLQGAIDLLAVDGDRIKIIDYKYSGKSDEGLKATYARQIDLYKKAAAIIFKTDIKNVSGCIVNIYRRRTIDLN